MSYGAITDVAQGYALQIHFNQGYMSLLNESVAEFQNILKYKVKDSSTTARETSYAAVGAFPHSNFQMMDPGATDATFITAGQTAIGEYKAKMKQMESVVKVQQNVWMRAQKTDLKYVNPLEMEQHIAQIVNANALAIKYQGDGSGVLAAISSATPAVAISGGYVTYSLRNGESYDGFVRWLKEGQRVSFYDPDSTARSVVGGSHSYFQVEEVTDTLSAPTVKLSSRTSAGALNTSFSSITSLAADDVLYDAYQATNGAITDISTTVADWGDLVNMPGLISLGASDGRVVNGVTHSGLYAGMQKDLSAAALEFSHFGEMLTKLKNRNSMENYDWKEIEAAGEVFDYLAEINAGQQFLIPFQDERGAKKIGFHHRDTHLVLREGRYTPSYRLYLPPVLKKNPGNKDASKMAPIQFRFTDWDFLKTPDGRYWRQDENSSGQQVKAVRMDMVAWGTFLTPRASTIGTIKNFTI